MTAPLRIRRRVLSTTAVLGLVPMISRGQTSRPLLAGVLITGDPSFDHARVYLEGNLPTHGWTPGQDVLIESRACFSDPERIAAGARELIALRPDVLYTNGNTGVMALTRFTTTVPIVAPYLHDPVGVGLARSLAHPAGNVTGVTGIVASGVLAKRMQMTAECVPTLRRMAALWAVKDSAASSRDEMVSAARALGLELDVIEVADAASFPPAFERITTRKPDALIMTGVSTISQQMPAIIAFALKQRLPASWTNRENAKRGLFMTYGPDPAENHRRAVTLVDRILRGAKAGDLPIEQPNGYDLAINLQTARAIGVKVPPSLLKRADLVID